MHPIARNVIPLAFHRAPRPSPVLSRIFLARRYVVEVGQDGCEMSGNDPEVIEKHKRKVLKKKDKGDWDEKLATVAEADIKADRNEAKPAPPDDNDDDDLADENAGNSGSPLSGSG
ncbi:hypothetical protein HK104_002953 [Borealophlyctis nickersoniae]|nr:hypothetical protein HK104_002953 [Borealophlyctis nickersoniae]